MNAALTLAGRVHPIVVTLGTMTVFRGLLISLTGGDSITDLPRRVHELVNDARVGRERIVFIGRIRGAGDLHRPASTSLGQIHHGHRFKSQRGATGRNLQIVRLADDVRRRRVPGVAGRSARIIADRSLQSGTGHGLRVASHRRGRDRRRLDLRGPGQRALAYVGALLLSLIYNAVVLWQISGLSATCS